ncbi:MAG: GNAT family N-acetyltransferase [Chitinophagaceae bacterium]|nr:GNAT family N-acetyltransferase [Chitinophagaceae bacterium]
MSNGKTVIIDFKEEYSEDFKRITWAWITKYFKPEQADYDVISTPKESIIDKGGYIFFAKRDGKIIGTAALLKIDDEIFELSKMGVVDSAIGTGAGNLLLDHCIKFAVEHKIKQLILYSNTSLGPAIHLYRKYGFHEAPLTGAQHERANIKMVLDL